MFPQATPSVRGHHLGGTDNFNHSHSIKRTANQTNNTSYSQPGENPDKKPKYAQEHVVLVDVWEIIIEIVYLCVIAKTG